MTDRAWLETTAARYLHRDDLTAADYDAALYATTADLGRDLRAPENELVLEYAEGVLADPQALPVNYREMRTVEVDIYGGAYSLQAASKAGLNQFPVSGGTPARYAVMGSSLYIRPFQAVVLRAYYWSEPDALVNPTDTNPVMTRYPHLYLYRVLAELAIMTQDVELAGAYMDQYSGLVGSINMQSSAAQYGDSPVMIGS